jgi:hypothetical protein
MPTVSRKQGRAARRRRGAIALCAVVVLLGTVAATRCLSTPDSGSVPAATASANTVTASRQDISVVLTLDAQVVASPLFNLNANTAPNANTAVPVVHAALTPGQLVHAGDPIFTQAGVTVRAPVDATFLRWLAPAGAQAPAGLPVAALQFTGFGMSATLAPEDSYRLLTDKLTAKAEITNGPGPFDCSVLTAASGDAAAPADSATPANGATSSGNPVLCAIPATVKALDGLAGLVAINSGQVTNALTLPLTAVDGSAQSGTVFVVGSSGKPSVRHVGLGVTDGNVVQITTGLRDGDVVLATPPTLSESQ